jgi:hypothetical protein
MFLPSDFGGVQRVEVGEATISPLEWRVALLAAHDADRGGWKAAEARFPRLRRLFEMLTGEARLPRLADERLEKLRLFLCMARRGDRRAELLAGDLLAMGFVPVALRKLAGSGHSSLAGSGSCQG